MCQIGVRRPHAASELTCTGQMAMRPARLPTGLMSSATHAEDGGRRSRRRHAHVTTMLAPMSRVPPPFRTLSRRMAKRDR